MNKQAVLIAIDWGTTSFRAWLVSARGQVLQRASSAAGLLSLARNTREESIQAYEDHLVSAIGTWMATYPGLPVIMCGMVGSKHGWVEAPYVA
jgi:2-dehydro-3-deoxygalactonokinase